jgi:toluene monooxygenase system protein E
VQGGDIARSQGDTLLGLLTQAQMRDAERHRRWAGALVKMALETEGNREVLQSAIDKWRPLADAAIDAYCNALPESEGAADYAKAAVRDFRQHIGLS